MGGSLTPLQTCSQCILQPQLTGPLDNHWERSHIHDTQWGSLTPLQKCSRCILQPQPTGPLDNHWERSHIHDTQWGESYPFAEMQSVYSTASADWATRQSLGEVLPLCRDAVDVFCSPSWLGQNLIWIHRCCTNCLYILCKDSLFSKVDVRVKRGDNQWGITNK